SSRAATSACARATRSRCSTTRPSRPTSSPLHSQVDNAGRMELATTAHTAQPWRIHRIAADFRIEDVWALPTPGGPDDFARLVQLTLALDPGDSASCAVRSLFALRWQIGRLLGWDQPDDLRGTASEMEFAGLPFSPLYLTDDEFAAEIANRTMHGVLHLGWVRHGAGYRGQMAVLVKRNGLLGTAYMAAIAPF